MDYILGLDPSIKKSGFVVLKATGSDNEVVDKGLLKTNPEDGITVLRLLKQQQQIKNKILEYDIHFIGMEAPFFMGNETEKLYALNQFLHTLFLKFGLFVVAFPPSMLKKLTRPDLSAREITKSHMKDAAKTALNLHGHRLAEDVADAFWAGYFGKRFFRYFIEKSLKETDLKPYEKKAFCGKHVFKRGAKKGNTEYQGIKYRENELFFDFKKIKERMVKAHQKMMKERKVYASSKKKQKNKERQQNKQKS